MGDRSKALSRHSRMRSAETLLVVLGDQLDREMPALRGLDKERDAVWMAEVREEAEHVPSHRQRTVLFLAAMRHFALELIDEGYRVRYGRLDDRGNTGALGSELDRAIGTLGPSRVLVTRPGDHRVERSIAAACRGREVPLEIVPDESFTCTLEAFREWSDDGRKQLVMEYFYRERRRALGVLLTSKGTAAGGKWNFDADNRKAFKRAPQVPPTYRARPDAVTREVMQLVEATWPDAYGKLDAFHWPVTPAEARRLLADFIDNRLASFGTYEDAMWAGEPVLYHSRLASSLNLKLIRPMECVEAAVEAWAEGRAKINNVEGFVRQIIGWREFIRGVYYREGPGYLRRNGLGQRGRLPDWFWTGETEMNCLRHCIGEVVEHGWGHHIPRLMVIGNFALIAGVRPQAVNDWFLAMYVDAVDWVTAPNVLGMSQHADHGVVGTKPYAASGKYIKRMSNYCDGCRFDVNRRVGDNACPFNTFYWDFLIRHRERFADNPRMGLTLKNVDKLGKGDLDSIKSSAADLRRELGVGRT